ncbi:MAG: ATP synthase subunit I [Desulfopila sp.]
MTDEIVSLQKMQVAAWGYLVIITLGSWYIMSWSFAWAVFAGGVISILSFAVSHHDISGFFESLGQQQDDNEGKEKVKKSRTGFLIRFWFRIGIIGVVLFLLIRTGEVNVFGLILGLSTVVFTVTLTALRVAGRYLFSGRR